MKTILAATLAMVCLLGAAAQAQDDDAPSLTPKLAQQLGGMLERDWKGQPEWAQEMVALLKGGGMGMGEGWFRPSQSRYSWETFSKQFDRDSNSQVMIEELPESKQRALYFARLDANRDAMITAADFDPRQQSPESRFASQLFYKLDVDSNGRVTPMELSSFFKSADREGGGYLTPADFATALSPPRRVAKPTGPPRKPPAPADMIAMLLNGELGSLGAGPKLNHAAPEFKLKTFDGAEEIALSAVRKKKKPIVLIFGSFT